MKMISKVIIIGPENVGRTTLLQSMQGRKKIIRQHRMDWGVLKLNTASSMELMSLSHDFPKTHTDLFLKEANVGIFCFDLKEMATDKIIQKLREDMEHFKRLHGEIPCKIILVGTKSDETFLNVSQGVLEGIKERGISFDACIAVSASRKDNIPILKQRLAWMCAELQNVNNASQYEQAKTDLLIATDKLPFSKQQAIIGYLGNLEIAVANTRDLNAKAAAVLHFSAQSRKLLHRSHPHIKNIALGFAATVTVTLIASAVGFSIGLALGAWSGPGALVVGIIAGGSVGILGLASTARLDHTLFQQSKLLQAASKTVDNFVDNYTLSQP